MKIAMATANFYSIPFDKALEIINRSGYEYIELDCYWKGGDNWEVAQHLKGIKPKEVLKMVKDSGLKIASLHDMGGVIENNIISVVSSQTYEYLEYEDIPCIIFHTPHMKTFNQSWWNEYKNTAIVDLKDLTNNHIICIENMTPFEGYTVPLLEPNDMLEFSKEANVYVTIDTTHYAECGIDILYAAKVLNDSVKTIHLSDFSDGKRHQYIGEGDLDFYGFYNTLKSKDLYLTTLECSIPTDNLQMAVEKSRNAKTFLEKILWL